MKKPFVATLVITMMTALAMAGEHPTTKEHPTTQERPAATPEKKHEHPTAPAEAATTVKGEILDLVCYLAHGGQGKDHISCAVKCIKEGAPVGILSEDGQVYLIVEHEKVKAYRDAKGMPGQIVKVTGKLIRSGGLQAIQISKVEK